MPGTGEIKLDAKAEASTSVKKRLFAYDFDLTITSEHTTNKIDDAGGDNLSLEQRWDVAKTVTVRGDNSGPDKEKEAQQSDAKAWKELLEQNHADGHEIAIVTFSSYPETVTTYLKEIVGLSDATLKRIHVNAWLPPEGEKGNKNEHIEQSLKHFKMDPNDFSVVILIDDTSRNLTAAQSKGAKTIEARCDKYADQQWDVSFFATVKELSTQYKVADAKIVVDIKVESKGDAKAEAPAAATPSQSDKDKQSVAALIAIKADTTKKADKADEAAALSQPLLPKNEDTSCWDCIKNTCAVM